jgi:group I intron endonuclease
LQNAFNKYGEEAFAYTPIIVCREQDLIMYEQVAMDYYDACAGGYNIRPKAESCLGVKHSEKSKDNFRKGAKGRVMPPMSEESKRKKSISAKMRGAKPPPMTQEQKERVRELTRQRMLGNKPSQEARAKMAAAKLGKKLSTETKEKMKKSRLLFISLRRSQHAD